MATSAERKALNEDTFRTANERLERAARELDVDEHSPIPFLCECPRTDCTQVVLVTVDEYEDVRSNSRRGLAASGHEDLEIENVLARTDRFLVTEKFGRAGEMHVRTDDRAR